MCLEGAQQCMLFVWQSQNAGWVGFISEYASALECRFPFNRVSIHLPPKILADFDGNLYFRHPGDDVCRASTSTQLEYLYSRSSSSVAKNRWLPIRNTLSLKRLIYNNGLYVYLVKTTKIRIVLNAAPLCRCVAQITCKCPIVTETHTHSQVGHTRSDPVLGHTTR